MSFCDLLISLHIIPSRFISFQYLLELPSFKKIFIFIFGCAGFSLSYVAFPPVAASRGFQLLCEGFSLWWPLLWTQALGVGFSTCGSQVLGQLCLSSRGPEACGIFLDQGSNLVSPASGGDSKPVDHHGGPPSFLRLNTAPLYVYHALFIHSSISGHLGFFLSFGF